MGEMVQPLLQVSGLTAGYGPVLVLREVSLEVRAGEIVSIVGSNGAGKTTLFRAISGLLSGLGGRIIYQDREIRGMNATRIARLGLSHVPEGRQVFVSLSVKDNLLLGAYQHASQGRSRVDSDLEEVYSLFPRLKELGGRSAGALSGGEQQMLAIGRAMMSRPKLIMLDEPSLGLSPRLVGQVFEAIPKLKARMAVLLVEQNARAALEISDKAYVMELGRIVNSGPSSEIAKDSRVVEAYLGSAV